MILAAIADPAAHADLYNFDLVSGYGGDAYTTGPAVFGTGCRLGRGALVRRHFCHAEIHLRPNEKCLTA